MPANQFLTLKDLAALNRLADPASVGLVDNIINYAPEVERVVGRSIPGISYPATILTAIGSNLAFRKVNSGVPLSAFSVDIKRFNTFPLDGQVSVDDALVEERMTEAGESRGFVFATYATSLMRQKALSLGKQFYAGSSNDPNGCPGLIDFLTIQRTQVDSRTGLKIDQVVDAGGTVAGQCEIVWFIKMGEQGVHWMWGKGRAPYMNTWIPMNLESPDSTANSKKYSRQWRSNLFGWVGLSMAQYHAVGAIINVNSTPSGATSVNPLTDALVAELWAKWPVTLKPDICFATQNAIRSLQLTRTVTLFANSKQSMDATEGTAPIAKWPVDLPTAGGIPIVPTDSIQVGNQVILN